MLIEMHRCTYTKEAKTLHLSTKYTEGLFPKIVGIRSHHTGNTVWFKPITWEHPKHDPDFWDGELALYEPADPECPINAEILSLHHGW